MSIAALYVLPKSIYKDRGLDCYDKQRDARFYTGPGPVIAHPPCPQWSRMRRFAKSDPDEWECALIALWQVRNYGGILEHPHGSTLFTKYRLPLDGSVDKYGGYCLSVNQHWWGHRARKRTWLYIVGIDKKDLPAMPLRFDAITHSLGSRRGRNGSGVYREYAYRQCNKSEFNKTPPAFADWLIEAVSRVKRDSYI